MKARKPLRSLVFVGLLAASLSLKPATPAWAEEDAAHAPAPAAEVVAPAAQSPLRAQAQDLPASFDLRAVDYDGDGKDVRCFVTPVRNQSPYGICWGFATTAAAETNILATKLADDPNAWKTLDFSEKQLAYFTHWHVDDPTSSQNGEGMYPVKMDSFDDVYSGGSVYLGAHTYAAGTGPTRESRDEALLYRGKNGIIDSKGTCYAIDDDWSLANDYRLMQDYVLKESYMLPSPYTTGPNGYQYNPEATRIIKEHLYNLNAVTIGFTADTSRPWAAVEKVGDYMSCETWAHYTWKYDMPNHAVTIIGWDDAYPKENFKNKYSSLSADQRPAGYTEPEGDGAWLVRNSWGAGTNDFPDKNTGQWGIPAKDENGQPIYLKDSSGNVMRDEGGNPIPAGSGYFWLSYYDRSIMDPEVLIFDTEITTPGNWSYDQSTLHRDQYDLMPVAGTAHNTQDALSKSANVFTSEAGEHVVAISYEAAANDVTVTYEIYLLANGFTSPVDGQLVAQGTQTHKYKGFYMAYPEEAPIILQPGQSYSIVLTQQCADQTYRVNVPSTMGENADLVKQGQVSSYAKSVVNPGESFLFVNGEWQDWSVAVVRTQLIPDTPPEVAAIMGNMDSQYDNFPIKGYAFDPPEGAWDAHVRLAGDAENVVVCKDGTTTVKLEFYGSEADKVNPDTAPVTWKLVEGSEEFVELTPTDGPTAQLTWKKAGNARVYVEVLGVGSLVIPVHVSQVGHDWGEPSYAWSADHSSCTAERACASCGEVERETVQTSSEVTKEPAVGVPGTRRYTATFTAAWARPQTKDVEIPALDPAASYAVVAGDGGIWVKGGSSGLEFTTERSRADEETFGRFVGARVDGKELKASDYRAKAGSLVLTLLPAYLDSLEAGSHALELRFDDGAASASFQVTERPGDQGPIAPRTQGTSAVLPRTADAPWPGVLPLVAVAATALALGIAVRRREG